MTFELLELLQDARRLLPRYPEPRDFDGKLLYDIAPFLARIDAALEKYSNLEWVVDTTLPDSHKAVLPDGQLLQIHYAGGRWYWSLARMHMTPPDGNCATMEEAKAAVLRASQGI